MKKIIISLLFIILSSIFCISSICLNNAYASSYLPQLTAKSYVVMDQNGKVLIENNADTRKEVASICKLMTTLLTLEAIDSGKLSLDEKVMASSYACSVEGSQAFLDAGSEYVVRDLIKSVIVASANDSAIVLAESVAGSEDSFVEIMNNRAMELGMSNTLYSNSTGLSCKKEQYSTAKDTALILNEISKYPLYREDCKIWMDKLVHPSGRETELVNTNRLIKYYPYCQTGKTGYTDEAGYCLSSTALNNNLKLTCVVLGCDTSADRFSDSVTLYNEAFATYTSKKVLSQEQLVDCDVLVVKGKEKDINLVFERDSFITYKKGSMDEIELKYNLPNQIEAPINKNDFIGTLDVLVNGEIVDSVNILANENVEKQTYKDVLNKILNFYGLIN